MQNDQKQPVVIGPNQSKDVAPINEDDLETNVPTTADQHDTDHPVSNEDSIEWTASEFVAHNKGFSWYLGLSSLIIVSSLLVYLLTKSIFSSIMVLLIGIIFGIAARRQPKTISYGLNGEGVKVGEKYYSYSEFKTFSIVEQGAIYSILLVPLKRFMPPINMYYEPDQGDEILSFLTFHLPHEEASKDHVEQLMHRLKF